MPRLGFASCRESITPGLIIATAGNDPVKAIGKDRVLEAIPDGGVPGVCLNRIAVAPADEAIGRVGMNEISPATADEGTVA